MKRKKLRHALEVMLLLFSSATAQAVTVEINASTVSPVPVGTIVTFGASLAGATSNDFWYRFSVRRLPGQYQMIRDFGPVSSLDWTAAAHEGIYEMEVAARRQDSGDVAVASILFQFQPIATGGQAIVSRTTNPLVFLYSAPPCMTGGQMRVEFNRPDGASTMTPYQPCQPGLTMNFYLAGMRPQSKYKARHMVASPFGLAISQDLEFTTGELPAGLYRSDIVVPYPISRVEDPILLGSPFQISPVAHDLDGNVLWYGPTGLSYFTRVQAGGNFWGLVNGPTTETVVVRKFDLVGMTLLETNAARVNEQLRAQGKREITDFHHEARPLAGGRVAVLANVEEVLSDVQGSGPVDVLGDMIIVLDEDLKVVWTWDAFDHLDTHRMATLEEICTPHAGGCPLFFQADIANDWTHGNSIQETGEGNLLYSSRHQDWIVKIAYDHGTGDGHVIWRLGKDGDFQFLSNESFPWFSHQHDAHFEIADSSKLIVFDNGNTRVNALHEGNSRGQVFAIDEQNRTATPILNADLGVYSQALGAAERLGNGNYHFDAGFVFEHNNFSSYSFEVNRRGGIRYEAHMNALMYRTFRMTDMYTPD